VGPLLWSDEELSDLLQVCLKSVTCYSLLQSRVKNVANAGCCDGAFQRSRGSCCELIELSDPLQLRLQSMQSRMFLAVLLIVLQWLYLGSLQAPVPSVSASFIAASCISS
jgi:hypothetical protein